MSPERAGTVVQGRVAAVLPRGLFAVRTEGGKLVAGLGREAAHVVRVKPGDAVLVRLSPRDPTRGRIVGLAGPGEPPGKEDGR
ncbi:MAG: translation initiation factor IF-1 [Myxococcales bacterium]|nr:translation initiation factor IF-1 [Myxococcales bacterium]